MRSFNLTEPADTLIAASDADADYYLGNTGSPANVYAVFEIDNAVVTFVPSTNLISFDVTVFIPGLAPSEFIDYGFHVPETKSVAISGSLTLPIVRKA